MNTATEIKNSTRSEVDVVNVDNSTANTSTVNTSEDVVTVRIPQKITLELPRSFSFDIPKWVGPALIATGIITFLSIVTGGAIWHFWWLIFCVPWFWNRAFWNGAMSGGCSSKSRESGNQGWNGTNGYGKRYGWGCGTSGRRTNKQTEPSPTSEMYV